MRDCCEIKETHSFCGQVTTPDTKQGDNNNKKEKNKQEKGGGAVKEVISEEAPEDLPFNFIKHGLAKCTPFTKCITVTVFHVFPCS